MKSIYKTNNLNWGEVSYIKEPYGFIYIITNLINGKRYIGQKKFDDRGRWRTYTGGGKHLSVAKKMYGRDNFTKDIVDVSFTKEELNEKEKEWIDVYDAVRSDDYYNLIEGGETSNSINRENMIKVVCINNGMIFESIEEAVSWSGHSRETIKKTFKKRNEGQLTFRSVPYRHKNEKFCIVCGDMFVGSNNTQKRCSACLEKCPNSKFKGNKSRSNSKSREYKKHIAVYNKGKLIKKFEYKSDARGWISKSTLFKEDYIYPHHFDRLLKTGDTYGGYKFKSLTKREYNELNKRN